MRADGRRLRGELRSEAERRWSVRPWTDHDLAAVLKTTPGNICALRARYLRDMPSVLDEFGRRAWYLPPETDAPKASDVPTSQGLRLQQVLAGYVGLAAEQAAEIARLRALTQELEELIVTERIRRKGVAA